MSANEKFLLPSGLWKTTRLHERFCTWHVQLVMSISGSYAPSVHTLSTLLGAMVRRDSCVVDGDSYQDIHRRDPIFCTQVIA